MGPRLRGGGEAWLWRVDTDSDSDEVPDCDDESNTPKILRRLQQVNEAVEKWKQIRMATWSRAQFLLDPNRSVHGSCGGGEAEIESDSDGLPDRIDECLQDHEEYLRCVRGC